MAQPVSNPAGPDPRLAGPQIAAMQAMLGLREAEMRALAEDMNKKLQATQKDWTDTFQAWCGARPACGLEPPPAAPAAEPEPKPE